MFRQFLLLSALMLMIPLHAASPSRLLPRHLSGSMMPYDFSRTDSVAVWPDSLQPVYVAHVARHGARYISSEKKLDNLRKAVAEARKSGRLTEKGESFARLLDRVEATTAGRWGALSDVGCREEQRLAEGLYAMMPSLLGHADVNAISSYVPRVVRTMYEFCHSLTALSSGVRISASEGRQYNYLVRCFSADSAYAAYRKDGDWTAVYDRMLDSIVSPEPARRLFGNGLSESRLRHLSLDVYDILQSLEAFGMEAPDDEFMTRREYEACWQTDNLAHYLRNTATPLSDLAAKASAPLLLRIVSDADMALDGRRMAQAVRDAAMPATDMPGSPAGAGFYFGHAETLMPLLSLMRVEGCYDMSADFATLHERWKDYEVVPLGANIDIMFLASPSGSIYVALRHNGRFVAPMPENAGNAMIVPWQAYRSHLISLIP